MQNTLFQFALGFGVLCFLMYVVLALRLIPDPRDKADGMVNGLRAPAERMVDPKDFAEVVKSLATLLDSLVKAGPALWSLIGTMLFFLIAALAAGLFSSGS